MTFLPAEAFNLGDRQALNTDGAERFLHFVEFEWFDNGDDEFHNIIELRAYDFAS